MNHKTTHFLRTKHINNLWVRRKMLDLNISQKEMSGDFGMTPNDISWILLKKKKSFTKMASACFHYYFKSKESDRKSKEISLTEYGITNSSPEGLLLLETMVHQEKNRRASPEEGETKHI